MLNFFRALVAAIFMCLHVGAIAQTAEQLQLLGLNGANGLSQAELQQLLNQPSQGPQRADQPRSPQQPRPMNSLDANNTLNLNSQNPEINEFNDQNLEKPLDEADLEPIVEYYRVLTGEELALFGMDVFSFEQDPSILFYNTISQDYVLASGDALSLSLRGILSLDVIVTVNQNGEVNLPDMDPIQATGLTLAEFEEELGETLRVEDASARAFVNLDAARLVPVRITGSVKEPKSIAVPAYTPLSRVLGYVGELGGQASLRDITLIYDSGERKTFDLYDVLLNDADFDDPIIDQSVRIHFGSLGATFAVSGFGGRAAIYEMPKGRMSIDNDDLFKLANLSLIPPGATLELLEFDSAGIASSIAVERGEPFQLSNGQGFRIQFVKTRNVSSIGVSGATIADYTVSASGPVSVARVLRDGAVLSPNAVLAFALIEQTAAGSTGVRAIDLRHAFSNPDRVLINPGEKLTVFDQSTFDRLLSYEQLKLTSPSTFRRDLDVERTLRSIRMSGASDVFLNDALVAILAPLPEQSVADIIDSRLNVPVDLSQDFAVMIDPDNRAQSAKAFTLNTARIDPRNYTIPRGWRLHLFTEGFLSNVELSGFKSSGVEFSLASQAIEAANPAEITLDGRRIALVPAGTHLHRSEIAATLRNSLDLYPLYAGLLTQQGGTLFYNNTPTRLDSLIGNSSDFNVAAGQRIDIFSTAFVRSVFEEVDQNATALDELTESDEADQLIEDVANDIVLDTFDARGTELVQTRQASEVRQEVQEKEKVKTALNGLKVAAKLVRGAVEQPGLYPVAGTVTLAEMLSVANGVLPNADIRRVNVRSYYANASGELNLRSAKKIDLNSVAAHKIVLKGDFDVQVPSFINNASVGQIVLSGEVQRPGEYTFSRKETLHDVIQRAGGLTAVGYPLGAVFTRDSLRDEQTVANITLARQLEQSILSLSQSDRAGAGEQISAVLTFAQQLKTTPVSGRQAVNVALRSQSNPIYLQDGDEVFIPQRPSHVGVIGSVFSQVSADFSPTKTLLEYVDDAGGFDRIADQKNIFMVLPNGKSKPIGSASDAMIVIPPGAVIVVPPKTDKLTALGLSQIVSQILSNIATSLLTLNALR